MVKFIQLISKEGENYKSYVKVYIPKNIFWKNTSILVRRELRSPSYLVFWNFTKYFRKVFETALNDYTWLAECGKIYTLYFHGGRKQ